METAVPTLTLFCEDDEVEVLVQVTTDVCPSETQVLSYFGQSVDAIAGLTTASVNSPSARAGEFEISEDVLTDLRFTDLAASYLFGACVPSASPCIQVVMIDTIGDGLSFPGRYEFTYGTSAPVGANDGSWECRSYQFGSGCVNLQSIPVECLLTDIQNIYPENVVEGGI
jgi:hypothetical protein